MSVKRREHEEEHIDETWLIPYADLLTLLLALFIVLFASSTVDTKKFNAMRHSFNQALTGGTGILEKDAPEIAPVAPNSTGKLNEGIEQLKIQIDQHVKDKHLAKEVETKLTTGYLIISIRDYALFDSGSAVVKNEARETLYSISNMLVEYPNFEVLVSGHTDDVPISTSEFESNWDLSADRALNVLKLLLKNKRLSPANFSAVGYAEFRPVASNQSESGRANNRRVELSIKRK